MDETKKQAKELGAGQVLAYTADLQLVTKPRNSPNIALTRTIENFVHCLSFGDFSTISDQAYTQIKKLTHTNLLLTMFLSKRLQPMLHRYESQ